MHSSVIHESGYIEIGGIPQWVLIRGDDGENPVLLYVVPSRQRLSPSETVTAHRVGGIVESLGVR
jgi:hypothetical protein